MTFAVDDRFVDATGCYAVVSCCVNTCKALVVTQVEIRLKTILRHVTFAVLIRVQRTRVDVDIRVELLNGDLEAACLQQLANAGGDDALSQRGYDAACDEDVLCFHKTDLFYGLQNYGYSR